ncbi:hypothetical protein EDB87DRAFT_1650747 [Lactarius vividus]|nr:hypothetical protein EDB87DRAFT_1650747 [Lactarius vividus]
MALFYIPGAIRDVLAPYAVGKYYCLEILPLLNSPESLETIEELWDSPNDDVALSVRCAAAVVAAFMITPPRRILDYFVDPNISFIWNGDAGKRFLANRLGVGADVDDDPHSDDVRLRNIVRFLTDIKDRLGYMNMQWWTSDNVHSILPALKALFDTRHTEEYRIGHGMFDQQGSRASPAFVPAVQHDLITLTLEILARDPVVNVTTSRGEAFLDEYQQFVEVALIQAREQSLEQVRARARARARVRAQALAWVRERARARAQSMALAWGPVQALVGVLVLGPMLLQALLQMLDQALDDQALEQVLARIQTGAADSLVVIRRALEPVLQRHLPQIVEIPIPHDDTSHSQPPVLRSMSAATAATVPPNDGPVRAHAGPAQRSLPLLIEATLPSQYSGSLSSVSPEAAARESGYPPV